MTPWGESRSEQCRATISGVAGGLDGHGGEIVFLFSHLKFFEKLGVEIRIYTEGFRTQNVRRNVNDRIVH